MTKAENDTRQQLIVFWIGCSFPLFYGLSWAGIAGFFPPPAPNLSAAEVYEIYKENGVAIRLGMAVCLVVNCFCAPWAIAIWTQMRRLEPNAVPVWSLFQLTLGILNVVFFMVPTVLWMTAAFAAQFRPGFSPENLQVLNDAAWLLWFTTYAPTTLQCWTLGYVGLRDKRANPLFPRAWCYLQFWVGLAYVPAGFIQFFVEGPFSWVGLIGLWLPVGVYFLWFPITAWGLYRAIHHRDDAAPIASARRDELGALA